MRNIVVFSGNAHLELAEEICAHVDVPLSPSTFTRFSNDCIQVQLNANCREADVFVIQPLVPPVHDHLMELLQMLDAARGASASRVTASWPTTSATGPSTIPWSSRPTSDRRRTPPTSDACSAYRLPQATRSA